MFVSGIIPDDWKLASVVPVHKKDDKGQWKITGLFFDFTCYVEVYEKCIKKELLAVCESYLDPTLGNMVLSIQK